MATDFASLIFLSSVVRAISREWHRIPCAPLCSPPRDGASTGAVWVRGASHPTRATLFSFLDGTVSGAILAVAVATDFAPFVFLSSVVRAISREFIPTYPNGAVEAPPQGGEQSGAHGMRCHSGAGAAPGRERKGPRPGRRTKLTRLRSGWSTRPTRQSSVPLQARRPWSTRKGNSPRAEESATGGVRMGRSPCTKSSSRRPDQVWQHKGPGAIPFVANRTSLLCQYPRSRLLRETSTKIRGAPQRRGGVRSRGRRSIRGERGGRGALEEPTWLGGVGK